MKQIKALFLISLLAAMFSALGMTVSPSTSSAEHVWFYSDGGWSCYLDTQTIRIRQGQEPQYTVSVVKLVNGKNQGDFEGLGFANINGTVYSYHFNRWNGEWDRGSSLDSSSYASAAWKALQPYL